MINITSPEDKEFADKEIQVNTYRTQKIRSGYRNFDQTIKTALAAASASANISANQARICFKTSSQIFFQREFLLSIEKEAVTSENFDYSP